MKKIISLLLVMVMVLSACQPSTTKKAKDKGTNSKTIEKLTVQFVPSRDPKDIISQTKPLEGLLQKHLKKQGYNVKKVEISVGTSYEATGEALSAGSIDVGLIPGGTYVLYDDGAEVLLTATRKGYNNDSEKAKDWNANKPTKLVNEEVTYYRSMILAGPSEKGKKLAKKVNAGEKLTWEDLNSAKWGVRGVSSSAGYIYPYLWLKDNYGKGITDLSTVVEQDSYNTALAQLATGQLDVIVAFTDARIDNANKWVKQYNGPKDIWEDTNIIGVSDKIYNDTVSVSKNAQSGNMTPEFKEALANAFINLAKTEEGKKVISIYNHFGYKKAKSEDYNKERDAQKLMKKLTKH
ncbi:phosphate/phosphite/phosphonate ABC transporter substrate-binding protein [Helcococcus ovis]|uniref:phosphate/phosphite/phosphonate ABC transporter substrate-binding protein n=1 Tax=Helcococcus ovis TaxID=72026 RepID=UPI0038BBF38A